MFELRGRNYIVTGGAQGIGFAVTRAICEMGGNVTVLDIQEKPVGDFDALSEKFKVKTFYIQTDVTKEDSLHAGFNGALKQLGSIDGCVPCAGIAIDKPFIEQTWEEFTRIQEINVSSIRPFPSHPQLPEHCNQVVTSRQNRVVRMGDYTRSKCIANSLELGPRHLLYRTVGCQAYHRAERKW